MRGAEIRIPIEITATLERPFCGRTNMHLPGSIFGIVARVEVRESIGLKTAALRREHTESGAIQNSRKNFRATPRQSGGSPVRRARRATGPGADLLGSRRSTGVSCLVLPQVH